MADIIPAILPETFDDLRAKLSILRGAAREVQIDILDGIFVLGKTWPYGPRGREIFEDILRGKDGLPFWQEFDFEIDLMVDRPELVIADWVKAGASRVVVHAESRHDFAACLSAAQGNADVGVAINTATPLERLESYIGRAAFVQFMGIASIGRQGEPFDARVLEHIREFRAQHGDATIQVDGGVNLETARELIDAGADRLVAGSAILRADDPREAIRNLQKA